MMSVGFYVLYESARVYEWDGERWWIWTGWKWIETSDPAAFVEELGGAPRLIYLGARP